MAGMVLAPSVTVRCACQTDCNSNTVMDNYGHGYRGCDPHTCCDHPPEVCKAKGLVWANHACSYPPEQLGEALSAQKRAGVPTQ